MERRKKPAEGILFYLSLCKKLVYKRIQKGGGEGERGGGLKRTQLLPDTGETKFVP